MKKVFEKSIVAKRDMKKLHKIKFDDLMFLKPGTGIRADKYKKLIGLKIKKPIKELEILKYLICQKIKLNEKKNLFCNFI